MPNYRVLRSEKLIETVDDLRRRIAEVFPAAGLLGVAGELQQVVHEALATVGRIRRPNIALRLGVGVLIAAVVGLLAAIIAEVRFNPTYFKEPGQLVQFSDSSLATMVYLGGGIFFLSTLETRMKRRRALAALHELRALSHVVDMHQLRKTPRQSAEAADKPAGVAPSRAGPAAAAAVDNWSAPVAPPAASSPPPASAPAASAPPPDARAGTGSGDDYPAGGRRLLTGREMTQYLSFCTELLAIVSKIAAVYVQDFPDAQAMQAADQIETLTNGLSRKIWQKITLLNPISPDRADAPA
jgi:hypothetical protein